jgi:hypothetical protein
MIKIYRFTKHAVIEGIAPEDSKSFKDTGGENLFRGERSI